MSFFLKAAALALVLSGAGFGYSQYMHNRTRTVQSKCEAYGKSEIAEFNARLAKETGAPWMGDPLVCDPSQLYYDTTHSSVLPGVQGELLTAYREEKNGVASVIYVIAFLIILIGVLPACWHFFLARLSEFAAAIRRK
jgi:hypothetical protein